MRPSRRLRPYGLWTSNLSPAEAAHDLRFSDLAWGPDNQLLWLEERSDRGVIVSCDVETGQYSDLTPDSLPVRSRIGYGGGEFTAGAESLFFVSDHCIYRTSLDVNSRVVPLTSEHTSAASPYLSPREEFLVCIVSQDGDDSVSIVDTQATRRPQLVDDRHPFYMQPRWHPFRPLLAWVAWDVPNMPWDGSGLYLKDLDNDVSPRLLAGDPTGRTAVAQPEFSPNGRLLAFVSDENNWFNLRVVDLETGNLAASLEDDAEHAGPAWVQGLRTFAWAADSRSLYFIRSHGGFHTLCRFFVETGQQIRIDADVSRYSAFRQICLSRSGERMAMLASSAQIPTEVITINSEGSVLVHRSSSARPPLRTYLSKPRSVDWKTGRVPEGEDGDQLKAASTCHGLYYAPCNPNFYSTGLPPGVIRVHGGPTAQYVADYHPETQFLTSRGFAVLELNYRGSSGYGRHYRDMLYGQWGICDVEDLRGAAEFLVDQGLADRDRIAVIGGSAGGFTVLHAMILFPGVFRAAICLYPVSDLRVTAEETHRFERSYLRTLIGDPDDQELYASRSPLLHAGKIRDPVAIYHGSDDRVVPLSQSRHLHGLLESARTPNLFVLYQGEGHGWRKSETIEAFYRSVEDFLATHIVRAGEREEPKR